ncbi:MAG: serine/threonine-protein kinase [Pyrinomonadaceae bacterium]|nr:serine/threonine-protein kinase [Pyrinomonadaceae bacterium]
MIGQTVSHYRILKKLGEGAMGIVYLAEDTHLGRQVAIKFLSDTQDHHFRARFLREARAVSTLSHPHIAVVHDYGETPEGQPFIVMEYIKGETLSDLLHSSALTISQSVEIVEAVAEALSAAHARGIIHRDIKPSNVLVDKGGEVKVLDFGLVKQLHEEHAPASGPDANTLLARTSSNVVVGTPLYLSPEQAMGADVDARSDLFALGAMLYECLAGQPAFSGKSVIEIGAQILHFNPAPPSSINKRVNPELDRITLKALAKKPNSRYQTAAEMVADLRATRNALDNEDGHRTQRLVTSKPSHSSAFKSISDSLRRPRLSIAVFLVAVAFVALALWMLMKRNDIAPLAPFQRMKVTKLTNTGKSRDATISPDGKYVIYVVEENGQQSLWRRHVPTTSNTQIVAPGDGTFDGLTFSPDSNYLYYVQEKNDVGTLFKMPALGGDSQRLIANIDSHPSVSPDGTRLAFVRLQKTQGEYQLIVAASDGGEERIISTRKQGGFFSLYGSTAWSPNGKAIACAAGSFSGGYHMNLIEVDAQDGIEKPVGSQNWYQIIHVAWQRDGRALILAGSDQPVSPFQIWQVSYPEGRTARITNDLIDYNSLAQTDDARTLVTLQVDRLTNIWVMPNGEMGRATQITSGVGHTNGVSWTPEGKILYASVTGGDLNVWLMEADGNRKTQLTANVGVNFYAVASPDGRYVVFASNRTGPFNIWRMDADGSNPKQLTTGGTDLKPCFSPDSKWVVYESLSNGVPMLWKVSIDGGVPTQLTTFYSSFPAVSPDGKTIACRHLNEKAPTIALVAMESGRLIKTLNIPVHFWQRIRWSPDGLAVTYVDVRDGIANVWSQPIDGGQSKQLTDFKNDQIFSYDWSRDGKELVCERGMETSDVVLITDFQE